MKIYTLYVGQGNFNVIVGDNEAIIVDSYVPLTLNPPAINIKAALAKILEGKLLKGLMITGYDADHFNEIGLNIILNKYRPEWIMYPKYFKDTQNAKACFAVIKGFETKAEFKKVSISLTDNDFRFYNKLSGDFTFEVFSPYVHDMTSSNNCSLVCKIKERSTKKTCLVTGDTENGRWDGVIKTFGTSLKADVMFGPHHGSKGAITDELMKHVLPDTVLMSAGIGNQFEHPNPETLKIIERYTANYFSTNQREGGISMETNVNLAEIATYEFEL